VLIVIKSVSLNLLEPAGPVQACNWIALPLYALCYIMGIHISSKFKHALLQNFALIEKELTTYLNSAQKVLFVLPLLAQVTKNKNYFVIQCCHSLSLK
jgi:hypothetical protein